MGGKEKGVELYILNSYKNIGILQLGPKSCNQDSPLPPPISFSGLGGHGEWTTTRATRDPPVNNSLVMQKEQANRNFSCIKPTGEQRKRWQLERGWQIAHCQNLQSVFYGSFNGHFFVLYWMVMAKPIPKPRHSMLGCSEHFFPEHLSFFNPVMKVWPSALPGGKTSAREQSKRRCLLLSARGQ